MISNKVSGLSRLSIWSISRKMLINRVVNGGYSTTPPTTTTENSTEKPVQTEKESEVNSVKTTFFKAFEKYTGQENFPKLLRNSALVRMGDPRGKIVEGVIHHIIQDDLYIDFGGKFSCVCVRPEKNASAYQLGTKVRIMLHDLELSTRFLGAATDLTILEADGALIGLLGEKKSSNFNEPPGKSVSEELLSSSS